MSDDSSESTHRQVQLDEVLAELMRAIDAGESVDTDEWLQRYPDFASELGDFFKKQERLEKLVRPLRQAVAHVLHVRCPHCHHPIELLDQARLSDISCPSCGSSFSLLGADPISDPTAKSFGHFELLGRVGVGQFGSVWKARDTKLGRTVAIKIPRNGRMDVAQTELFLRDARAAAQLKHPNIVTVHEVGKHDDTLYIVSDFVEGATLKEWSQSRPLTPREAAEFGVKFARALHHAHEAGVIHRDLKPGNIMIDNGGEPHIVDFGLAKREAGEITMTVEGQILGTPAYMSPEQARGEGHRVDRRADIYSAGVVLFELLTGELPFRGDKQMLIVQILNDEPPSPRKLNNSVPRDLETICLKCLAKEPAQRYKSGLSLAHDLEQFLFGEPISARPIGRLERTRRWCHRHPQVASLLAVTAVLLATVTAVTTWGYFREAALHRNLNESYEDLRGEQERAAQLQQNMQQLEQWTSKLQYDVTQLETLRKELAADVAEGRTQLDEGQQKLYDTNMQLARAEWRDGNIERVDYYLEQCLVHLREAAWHRLKEQVHPPVVTFDGRRCVAISPDGRLLASGGVENEVRVWEIATGRLIYSLAGQESQVRSVAFSPTGKRLAAGGGDAVLLWDMTSAELLRRLDGLPGVTDVEFSPDGGRLGSATDTTVILFDLETFERQELPGRQYAVFSGDGHQMATWTPRHEGVVKVVLFDLTSAGGPDQVAALPIQQSLGLRPAFHSFKKQLAVADDYGRIQLLDSSSAEVIQQFRGQIWANLLGISRDGRRLAYAGSTASDLNSYPAQQERFQVAIWNLLSERNERILPWYTRSVDDLTFSADGNLLATADDTEIKLWNVTPPHDPTEEIVADILNMDVGRLDWPQWGGSPSRVNTPLGRNSPRDWDIGVGVGRRRRSGALEDDRMFTAAVRDARSGGYVPKDSRNVKWAAPLGSQTYGNPVVANGRVFVGTNNRAGYLERYPPEIDLGVLLCFEEQTGKFLWQHSNEKLPIGRVNDWPLQGVCSTPVVDGNRLWYVSNRGEVVCLDAEGFYDGEDDGPEIGSWVQLFDVGTSHSEDLGRSPRIPRRLLSEFLEAGVEAKRRLGVRRGGQGDSWLLGSWRNGANYRFVPSFEVELADAQLLVYRITDDEGVQHKSTAPLLTLRDRLLHGLDLGEISASLRQVFQLYGVVLATDCSLKRTPDGQAWLLSDEVDNSPRTFRLRLAATRISVEVLVSPVDKQEGDVVWKLDMMSELGVFQHNMANCSMLTADGMLFVCTSNGVDQTHENIPAPDAPSFLALDRDTGEILWTDNSPGRNILHAQWASPSYGIFDGQPQVIFPGGDGWVYSFDPKGDGKGGSKLLWKFDGNPKQAKWRLGGRGTRNSIIAFPAIYDGLVYVVMGQDPEHGEGSGHLWCIDPTKRMDGSDVSAELAVDAERNVIPHRRFQAVDLANGESAIPNPNSAVVWHYTEFDRNGDGTIDFEEGFHRSMSIPAIKDDVLYIADFSGLFHCLHAKTGEVYWTYDMLAACWSSPLLVDGKVYICDEDGDVMVFRHSPDPAIAMKTVERDGRIEFVPIGGAREYELLSEFNMVTSIYMTPIVANNVLYIATRDALYAIQEIHQPYSAARKTD